MLKAYKICCQDDDHGAEIRFAMRAKDLRGRRLDFCDCEYIDLRVIRDPAFDDLAEVGKVSISDYLARGWCWPCSGCGNMVWGDETAIHVGEHKIVCSADCLAHEQKWAIDCIANGRAHDSVPVYLAELEEAASRIGATDLSAR